MLSGLSSPCRGRIDGGGRDRSRRLRPGRRRALVRASGGAHADRPDLALRRGSGRSRLPRTGLRPHGADRPATLALSHGPAQPPGAAAADRRANARRADPAAAGLAWAFAAHHGRADGAGFGFGVGSPGRRAILARPARPVSRRLGARPAPGCRTRPEVPRPVQVYRVERTEVRRVERIVRQGGTEPRQETGVAAPARAPETPFPAAPPWQRPPATPAAPLPVTAVSEAEVRRLTDRVVRDINRRVLGQRERLGRF